MATFGLVSIPTHYSIQPVDLARWAEENGFDSLFYGEHTHIPTSRKTPFPLGGELPMYYAQFFDPFIALTSAAAVTQKLKVGTSVHGVAFKDRWKITRERVLAMREIWTKEAAEFHGQFVDFDPIWCWPKPKQAGGPPVLMGAGSKWTAKRVAEYCDGWFPIDGPYDLPAGIAAIRTEADKVGRSMDEFDLSVITSDGVFGESKAENRIQELITTGFNRVLFLVEPAEPDKQWPVLERYAKLIRQFS